MLRSPSMTLSNRAAPAMTFYELEAPRAPLATGFAARIAAKFKNGLRLVQYSRMVQALSTLNDAQLDRMGLSRSDIPRHAHDCVYETEA